MESKYERTESNEIISSRNFSNKFYYILTVNLIYLSADNLLQLFSNIVGEALTYWFIILH